MTAVSVKEIISNASLPAGAQKEYWWNNASYGKAYVLEVVPTDVGSYQTGYSHTTELEITRQWRKLITTQTKGSIGVNETAELEIHFVVKNIGAITASFNVLLVTIG